MERIAESNKHPPSWDYQHPFVHGATGGRGAADGGGAAVAQDGAGQEVSK
jgi:hypothetical protein